ncbi:hypothetical protein A9K65_013885 [Mesorhizobium sp. WSM1497]|uniref:hypothetical protein n=1 Tax=Mesorhizobium sp. WSM1497 TaxID=278153 RepID=UPI000A291699|nr:hypothetical protein [Mesorhizobium sp. WSM1497]ARP64351.1 hypothetical protein A9K65_013885 [Mesorhizobium sp. WSM1497]
MDIQAPVWPAQQTAKELVREVLQGSQPGDIISVKTTIAAVRGRGRHLFETDCQLVGLIVDAAPIWQLLIAFVVREV